MAPNAGTGGSYAALAAELWSGLAGTLTELETIAADPDRLDGDDQPDLLRRLQYGLHRASENAYGLVPAGADAAHDELAAALAAARDATAEVATAIGDGGAQLAEPLVYEWRGALFRVRLARIRLGATVRHAAPAEPERPDLRRPLAACTLVVCGLAAFTLGAAFGLWPVWGGGMLAMCLSFLAYKP